MLDNLFISNKAVNNSNSFGNGGGMYFTCSINNKCEVLMKGFHNFTLNSADNSGGGIYWN